MLAACIARSGKQHIRVALRKGALEGSLLRGLIVRTVSGVDMVLAFMWCNLLGRKRTAFRLHQAEKSCMRAKQRKEKRPFELI
jgi:hypothetical protein